MTENNPERIKLESGIARLGLSVPTEAVDGLIGYMDLLKEWSGTYNLIAPRERDFLLARHVLDSLSIAKWLEGRWRIASRIWSESVLREVLFIVEQF